MFKRILLPTDGSAVSIRAAKAGVRFAKSIGARVVGYYAVESVQSYYYSEGTILDSGLIAELERSARKTGERHLATLERLAKAARVPFTSVCAPADSADAGIVRTARAKKCDVIFMASHGRSGLAKLVMGSVTQKVLAQSRIPVLVYR